jgi:hypothetical protein
MTEETSQKRTVLITIVFDYFRGELHQVACEKWPNVSDEIRKNMARMAAAAAWGLGKSMTLKVMLCAIIRPPCFAIFVPATCYKFLNSF